MFEPVDLICQLFAELTCLFVEEGKCRLLSDVPHLST